MHKPDINELTELKTLLETATASSQELHDRVSETVLGIARTPLAVCMDLFHLILPALILRYAFLKLLNLMTA
jgi:hypothetical protein